MTKLKTKEKKPSKATSLEDELDTMPRADFRATFSFNSKTSEEEILFLFNLWSRFFYFRFFKVPDAPFHEQIDCNNIRNYMGWKKYFVDIAFRNAAKTTRTKLFVAFAIANDEEHSRRYIKVLSADPNNSQQIVTDIYNMLINPQVQHYYPEIFEKTIEKREERMSSFTTATRVKMKAGSVGTDQRGQVQEESRPDFIWFDDFETRKTLRSAVITNAIWDNMEEAKNGLSKEGSALYNCNYLSERGNVHKLVEKKSDDREVLITPIITEGMPAWPERDTVEDIARIEKDADDFAGEYLCEPSAGADVFFDRASIDKQVEKKPIRVISDFKIYHTYESDHRYGFGSDVAGGVGLDSSTSVIIDFSTIPARVVATYQSNSIRPDAFGDEIKNQADRFGAPIVAPENNKFDMVIGRLKQIYDNIFFTEVKETRAGFPPKIRTYGWNTNSMTKPKMLNELKKAVADGHIELSDADLKAEFRSYTRDDLMDKDDDVRLTTRHFDLLVACAIAYQMRYHATVKKEDENAGYVQSDYERSGVDE